MSSELTLTYPMRIAVLLRCFSNTCVDYLTVDLKNTLHRGAGECLRRVYGVPR